MCASKKEIAREVDRIAKASPKMYNEDYRLEIDDDIARLIILRHNINPKSIKDLVNIDGCYEVNLEQDLTIKYRFND